MRKRVRIQKQFLEIQEMRTHYVTCGEGESLVFLHGGGASALIYKKLLKVLGREYSVVAPDLPGFGKSDAPERVWNLEDYAKFVEDFAKNLNLTNITLIGHSFGGGVALAFTNRSSRVSKLVLVDSIGLPPHIDFIPVIFKFAKEIFLAFIHGTFAFLVFKQAFSSFLCHIRDENIVVKSLKEILYKDYTPLLESVTTPTLILWGTKDWLFPPEEHAEKFKKKIPNSTLKHVKGAHNWCIFKPRKLVEALK